MTTSELVDILETLYAQHPNTQVSPKLIELWEGAFGSLDAKLVAKAVQSWMLQDTTGFPPVIGHIKAELTKLVAPFITLTYEEAKEQDHPIYRQAHRKVYGKPKPYNPNADPESMLKTRDIPFKERDCKAVYEELIDRASQKSIPELLELNEKITLQIADLIAKKKRIGGE